MMKRKFCTMKLQLGSSSFLYFHFFSTTISILYNYCKKITMKTTIAIIRNGSKRANPSSIFQNGNVFQSEIQAKAVVMYSIDWYSVFN